MSKFDTHGGYFAPKDYMRINEGGSHAENPNGGVQVGVDEQGIPNMLEEGEPVYKDYVYSDNIKASEKFLDANHIPVKYKGMLYSEIADDLFEEAEERPNDPVSRTGLEAMLGRLADSQEQQKQDSERRKLERELSKLSPEELEALQQELMAAQEQAQPQEQMPMPEQQVMLEEQAVMEQPVEQVPVEQQVPIMANGGLLRRYDDGGVVDEDENPPFAVRDNTRTVYTQDNGLRPVVKEFDQNDVTRSLENQSMIPYLGLPANAALVGDYIDKGEYGNAAWEAALLSAGIVPFGGAFARATGRLMKPVVRSIGRGVKAVGRGLAKTPKLLEVSGRTQMVKDAAKAAKDAMQVAKTEANKADEIVKELKAAKEALKADPTKTELIDKVAKLEAESVAADKAALKASVKATGKTAEAGVNTVGALTTGPLYNKVALKKEIDGLEAAYKAAKEAADAAPTDEALKKSAEIAKGDLEKAKGLWNKWWKHGEWQVKGTIGAAAGATALLLNDQAKDKKWSDNFLEQFNNSDSFVAPSDTTRAVTDTTSTNDYINSFLDYYGNSKGLGGNINKFDGETNRTGQMSRNKFASDVDALRDIINYEQPGLSLPFNVGQSMTDARTGFLKGIPVTSVGTNPYETGPVYSGTDFNEFLKWLAAYNGSRNAGHVNGTYAPDQKFNYGEYGNIKALEASAPYTTFTNDIIEAINGDDPDAKALALRYLQAYNAALPESARGKIVDVNGNLVDGWQRQYEKVRTYQPGVGHLSGNFQDMLLAYKAQNAIDKDKQDAIDRSKKATAVDITSYIQPPVEESVDEELPDGAPLPPAAAPNSGRSSGPYFPTFPRYAGAIGAGLLAAYDAFTPADRYTAPRYNPYVPVGHIDLQNQRYDPVDQNMIQIQMLDQGNSTQRALRNSGLGPSTGAAILAADNNTTRNLGTGFLQTWQANNQLRNAVTAANNQAEGMRAQFDYGVDAARQRALNEAQVRNAQNDLMLQRLNYEAEGQKYNALSNQLNAGFNALAGIGRENFARNQANSNTTLEGYKALGAGIGAHLPYYELFNPVIYGALGGYLKKIKK